MADVGQVLRGAVGDDRDTQRMLAAIAAALRGAGNISENIYRWSERARRTRERRQEKEIQKRIAQLFITDTPQGAAFKFPAPGETRKVVAATPPEYREAALRNLSYMYRTANNITNQRAQSFYYKQPRKTRLDSEELDRELEKSSLSPTAKAKVRSLATSELSGEERQTNLEIAQEKRKGRRILSTLSQGIAKNPEEMTAQMAIEGSPPEHKKKYSTDAEYISAQVAAFNKASQELRDPDTGKDLSTIADQVVRAGILQHRRDLSEQKTQTAADLAVKASLGYEEKAGTPPVRKAKKSTTDLWKAAKREAAEGTLERGINKMQGEERGLITQPNARQILAPELVNVFGTLASVAKTARKPIRALTLQDLKDLGEHEGLMGQYQIDKEDLLTAAPFFHPASNTLDYPLLSETAVDFIGGLQGDKYSSETRKMWDDKEGLRKLLDIAFELAPRGRPGHASGLWIRRLFETTSEGRGLSEKERQAFAKQLRMAEEDKSLTVDRDRFAKQVLANRLTEQELQFVHPPGEKKKYPPIPRTEKGAQEAQEREKMRKALERERLTPTQRKHKRYLEELLPPPERFEGSPFD